MAKSLDLAALYLSESVRLRRNVARIVGDTATAADLVHDVFLRMCGRRQELEGCDAAYLARSARNAAIDHIRAERVRSDYVAGVVPEQTGAATPSPYDVVAARDSLLFVDSIIRTLPERTRHIFLLSRVHGRTYAEIAAVFGISPSAVEKHLTRAFKAIRDGIEEN